MDWSGDCLRFEVVAADELGALVAVELPRLINNLDSELAIKSVPFSRQFRCCDYSVVKAVAADEFLRMLSY